MQFKKVEKKCEGKFITRYDITYETVDHQKKVYEMISRNGDITDFEGLHGKMADAVVIIATDETGEKILIDKEFRLAPGEWVYNFPAGLIDPGETPQESAKRVSFVRRQGWNYMRSMISSEPATVRSVFQMKQMSALLERHGESSIRVPLH